MNGSRWLGLAALAGAALCLLLAGRGSLWGLDMGMLGSALLVGAAWIALYAVSTMPTEAIEQGLAPGETQAWIGTVFMFVATLYFVVNLHLFQGESILHAPHSRVIIRNLVMLLIAWTLLSRLLASRWKGRVQVDERDRDIEVRAAGWGRGALILAVITLAVTLGFSPAEHLGWATHFMIGNLLVLALMCGWLVEYVATALMYWRDRR